MDHCITLSIGPQGRGSGGIDIGPDKSCVVGDPSGVVNPTTDYGGSLPKDPHWVVCSPTTKVSRSSRNNHLTRPRLCIRDQKRSTDSFKHVFVTSVLHTLYLRYSKRTYVFGTWNWNCLCRLGRGVTTQTQSLVLNSEKLENCYKTKSVTISDDCSFMLI